MAGNLSKLILIGNVGKDPEARYTPAGHMVVKFSLATNRVWKDDNGEEHKETTWFNISAWGKSAETISSYVKKGASLFVEGRLQPDPQYGAPRIWNAQDGTPRASYEVTLTSFQFLDKKGDSSYSPDDGLLSEPPVKSMELSEPNDELTTVVNSSSSVPDDDIF